MDWKNQLTKTPYLVLFIVLITIGVGTASALITITLDGDVIITGDTELQGDLTCTNCIDSTDIGDNAVTPSELSRFGQASFSLTEQSTVGSEQCILGEVRLCASTLVPKGWLPAEGQVLEISQNTALFSLIGTVYGGNGQTEFRLPDLSEINPKSSSGNVGLNYAICTEGVFPGVGDMIITGDLTVEGQTVVMGPIISHRPSGNSANVVIERPGGPTSENVQFTLSHRSTNKDMWIYGYDGTAFKNFVGFDYPNYIIRFPSAADTLVVDAANDKVGIGTDSPSSELEVVGDVAISGDLTVDGFSTHPIIYSKENTNNIPPGFFSDVVITCDAGDISVSGGFNLNTPSDAFIQSSVKQLDDGWSTAVKNPEDFTVSGTWFINCLDVSAPAHVP